MDLHSLKEKQAFIFDVDGTLYSQKKMRINMLLKLLSRYAVNIFRINELRALYLFRRLRETEQYKACSMYELEKVTAERLRMDAEIVKRSVDYWMFQVPLDIIAKCAYTEVIAFIREMQDNGRAVFIYSDYPAEQKLQALGIAPKRIFTSEDDEIRELKPSKKAMDFIVGEIGLPAGQIAYVGDRDDRDKASAALAGIDYCDIKELRRCLKILK